MQSRERRMMMSKITAEHLARTAYVYIRQSHPHQVKHNLESQRRQYGLADRGRELGWSEITIIDEDQGHSGTGVQRSGFEPLLVDVCSGKVGRRPLYRSFTIGAQRA